MRFSGPTLLLLAWLTAAPAGAGLLEELDLARPDVEAPLYLLQIRGGWPATPELTVHARRGELALVSGPTHELERWVARGARLLRLDEDLPIQPTSPRPAVAPPGQVDPQVEALVDQVQWGPLSAKIQWLVDFGTRYSLSDRCLAAADSLKAYFDGLGLATSFHEFDQDGHLSRNVMAVQTGVSHPDSIFVICAHYDSVSEKPYLSAPGADDNGSGTAAVMTAAQLFAGQDFHSTIYYLCFAGEEQGILGSQAWVSWAQAQGLNIAGALNFDMLGYWAPGAPFDLEIETNVASQWLGAIVTAAADLYTTMPYDLHVDDGAWWGDHYRFWQAGWSAINHEEAWDWYDPDFNPDYHSSQDLLDNFDPDFAVGNTKVAIAALATLADPVDPVAVVPTKPASLSLRLVPNPSSGPALLRLRAPVDVRRAEGAIYDLRGRRRASFFLPVDEGGANWLWDGRDDEGRELPSGSYLCRVRAGGEEVTAKILHLR